MTQPNAELAYRVLDHIEAHPEEWYQGRWYSELSCGTTACFAGHAVLLAGGKIVQRIRPFYLAQIPGSDILNDIRDAARSVLGISEWGADCLFSASNDLEDLRDWVAHLFGPRPAAQPSE